MFSILNTTVTIQDERLASVLRACPARERDIILLSYFLDMSDARIGEQMRLVRRTVAYRRKRLLEKLKREMEGNTDAQNQR